MATINLFLCKLSLPSSPSVLLTPFKPDEPPALILETLKSTWPKKDTALLEDSSDFFLNLCILITLR